MSDPIVSKLYAGESLLQWQVAHEMSVCLQDEGLVVADTHRHSYHLLRLHDLEFVYRLIRLHCLLRRLPTSTANFYVHHYGGLDVAEIALDGVIVNQGISRLIRVDAPSDGLLAIELEFVSCHPTLSIGCSCDRQSIYTGTGREQFVILQLQVEIHDATLELSRVPQAERITIADVGGAEGLQLKWMLKADRITPVVFEPNPSEAELLRKTLNRIPGSKVIENALAHTSGTRKLYITSPSGWTSLREPNFELLKNYSCGRSFNIVAHQDVFCNRYDELFGDQLVPAPDVIKIDVQGFEYEVLIGFGHLLESCLGIELEAHFYPIYKGQKLIGDIVNYLNDFGFVLRTVKQVPHFEGDSIEFDVFFTKPRQEVLNYNNDRRLKFSLLTEVWELPAYF